MFFKDSIKYTHS